MGGFKASLKGSGKPLNRKVQKQIDDYSQAMDKEHGENWQESADLDGNVIYQAFGGVKNGRFAMGNGSFKKSEVLATVKHKRARFSGSYEAMQRQNEELQNEVAVLRERDEKHELVLQQQQEMINQQQIFLSQQQGLMTAMCQKIGMNIPPEILAAWNSQHMRSSTSQNSDVREEEDMEDE